MRSTRGQTIAHLCRSTNDKFYLLRFVPLASALKDEAQGARRAKTGMYTEYMRILSTA